MKEFLLWYELFLKCPSKTRQKIVRMTMNAIKNYSDEGEGSANKKAGRALFAFIKEQRFRCRGVVPKLEYARLKGSSQELHSRWEHLFGSPVLLMEHAKLPVLLLVSPSIRADKSIIQEMKMNRENLQEIADIGIDGLTG